MKNAMRLLSVFLTVVMIFGVVTSVPFNVSAAETVEQPSSAAVGSAADQADESAGKDEEPVGATSGTTGDCTWSFDESTGTLTISGNGKMGNYSDGVNGDTSGRYPPGYYGRGQYSPWYSLRSEIQSVIIEKGVKRIGDFAFSACTQMTNITISDDVESIGTHAFYYCSILEKVTIPSRVTIIENSAFYLCSKLASIDIPDSVNEIRAYAFESCRSLKSVNLPNGMTSISDGLFYNCNSLTSLTIPNSVTSIGKQVISGCNSLTKLTIPNSVTSVGDGAFGYSGLTSLTVPDSVTSVGQCLVQGCRKITSFSIPRYMTTIASWEFELCDSLSNVVIHDKVTSIGAYAFFNCYNLTDINIPNSVTSIGDYAFSGCTKLEEITIPGSVKSIDSNAFYACSALAKITIMDGVTSIGEKAFYNCTGLTEITIPGSVTNIGKIAFQGCSRLAKITILDGVTTIGNSVFSKCTGLKEIIIPDTVTTIGDSAFYNCTELTKVSLQDGLSSIGERAFSGCSKLTEVIIPNSVTTIGDYAFSGCSKLTEVIIPNSITTIGNYVFSGCTGLTEIAIPNSVTSIGEGAFSSCKKLTEITIPNSVTSFGDYLFYNCSNLTKVTISNSVTSIGADAFYGCTELTEITIPDSVTSIGNGAFSGCTKLGIVTIPYSVTSIDDSAFNNCRAFTIYCYPNSCAEDYAIKNSIPLEYIYLAYPGIININSDAAFDDFIVKLSDSNGNTVSRIIKDGTALFSGVDSSKNYTVSLYNKNDRLISKQENIEFTDDKAEVSFDSKNLYSGSVQVKAADNTPLTDYSVEWFVNDSLTADSTAASVNYLKAGDTVKCRVKPGDSLKKTYEEPEAITRVIGSANEVFVFSLKKAPTKNITIQVNDENGSPVPNADISIVQQIDSKANNAENYTTDENGSLAVTLRTVQTTVKASEAAHFAANWSGVPDGSKITITLNNASGAAFIPNIKYQYCEGTVHTEFDSKTSDSITFAIFNRTKNKAITTFTYSNGRITVPYNSISTGDVLEFTATDSEGVFEAASAAVTYSKSGEAFELTMVERGKAAFEFTSNNKENLALIFNAGQKRVETTELGNGNLSGNLPAGSYMAVLIGNADIIAQVPDYNSLLAYGLKENTHFVKREFTVTNGAVTEVNGGTIPAFDESSILYTDSAKTYINVSPNNVSVNRYITATVNYSVAEKYRSQVKVNAVELIIPNGTKLAPGIKVNGINSNNYTQNGNTVRIPITDAEGKIVISLYPETYFDNAQIFADLVFAKNSKTARQPIGADSFMMKESFSVPETTANPQIVVSGTVKSKANVDIYVDGVHQTTVTASQMGNFKTNITFANTFNHSYHEVYFEVTDIWQNTYRSKTYRVEFDSSYVYVDSIIMSPNGHLSNFVKLYSADGNYSRSYYYWPGVLDNLTYTVEFVGDVTKISNPVLLSKTNDGKTIKIPLKRVGETNTFTCSYKYSNNFPDGLYVKYDCEKDIRVDSDKLKHMSGEIEKAKTKAQNAFREFEEYNDSLDDETKQLVKNEFTQIINESGIIDMWEQAADGVEFNVGDSENPEITLKKNNEVSSYRSWVDTEITEQELLAQGYTKVDTYNDTDKLYEYSDDTKIITADLSTGRFASFSVTGTTNKSDSSVGSEATDQLLANLYNNCDTVNAAVDAFLTTKENAAKIIEACRDKALWFQKVSPNATAAGWFSKLCTALSGVSAILSIIDVYCSSVILDEYMLDFAMTCDTYDYYVEQLNKKECEVDKSSLDTMMAAILRMSNALDDYTSYHYRKIASMTVSIASFGVSIAALIQPDLTITKALSITAGVLGVISGLTAFADDIIIGTSEKIDVEWYWSNVDFDKGVDAAEKELLKPCGDSGGGGGDDGGNDGRNGSRNGGGGTGSDLNKIGDPSGYVYEAVSGNRLSGVTVTAFYSENPDGSDAQLWEAEDFDQQNPLVTGDFGEYEWYVPDGYWQVKCEKEGYQTAYSDWLPVPPPQMDVNIAMTSLSAPELAYVTTYSDSVEFEFTQYIKPESINGNTVQISMNGTNVSGKLAAQNPETAPDGKTYSKRFVFTPDSGTLSGKVGVTVKSVQNYAGSVMDGVYSNNISVSQHIETIECDETLTINYGEPVNAEITLAPAEAAAGKTVNLSIDNTSVLSADADKVVVGADGKAKVKLSALLPGEATVTYTVDGTDLVAKSKITCTMNVKEQLPRVEASVPSGSEVEKGTMLTLTCSNPDAAIYYTLDLSCPCQENNPERKLYTEPIEITDGMQLIAYAVLDGFEESKTRLFTYSLRNDDIIGDANGDGVADIFDAALIQLVSVGKQPNGTFNNKTADVNNDGFINILDSSCIQRYAAGSTKKIGNTGKRYADIIPVSDNPKILD